jgi:hypothetical protein
MVVLDEGNLTFNREVGASSREEKLARQEDASLQEWHKQLSPGLGKEYWIDVLSGLSGYVRTPPTVQILRGFVPIRNLIVQIAYEDGVVGQVQQRGGLPVGLLPEPKLSF